MLFLWIVIVKSILFQVVTKRKPTPFSGSHPRKVISWKPEIQHTMIDVIHETDPFVIINIKRLRAFTNTLYYQLEQN